MGYDFDDRGECGGLCVVYECMLVWGRWGDIGESGISTLGCIHAASMGRKKKSRSETTTHGQAWLRIISRLMVIHGMPARGSLQFAQGPGI
jgi:hypothetical protein